MLRPQREDIVYIQSCRGILPLTTYTAIRLNCSNLQSVDLSNLDVSNITTMANMFCYCHRLQDVGDLSNWNLEKATSIQGVFMDCQSITSFDFVKETRKSFGELLQGRENSIRRNSS